MLSWLKKKKLVEVKAPVAGIVKPLEEVSDQVFSKGLIGQGVAVLPVDGNIYAPISGTLSVVFPTGHAFGIQAEDGSEYLIHIGIDTVALKGEGFQVMVTQGEAIQQGNLLVKVDFELLKQKGYDCDTIILFTTPKDMGSFELTAKKDEQVSTKSTLFKSGLK